MFLFNFFQPKTKKVPKSKKVAPAPYPTAKQAPKKVANPLFEKRPKNFGIGKPFWWNIARLVDQILMRWAALSLPLLFECKY